MVKSKKFLFLLILLFPLALIPTSWAMDITLAWDPNTEPDLAGYRIYYGTSSRNYISSIDVGNVTRYTIANLDPRFTYYFAVTAYDIYNNESDFSNEVSSNSTNALVDIYIAGINKGSYSIPSGGRVTPQYPGVMDGPVRVVSRNGMPIFVSQRVHYGGSFNEVMGYPSDQLTTEYWFPWYDQLSMSTWILVGNPSETQEANVDIYIAGRLMGTYRIPSGGRVTPQYPGVMDGPVRVVSRNGVPIFVSQRVHYGRSFNEVMGYPSDQLTTEYWFPWYDQLNMSSWILVSTP